MSKTKEDSPQKPVGNVSKREPIRAEIRDSVRCLDRAPDQDFAFKNGFKMKLTQGTIQTLNQFLFSGGNLSRFGRFLGKGLGTTGMGLGLGIFFFLKFLDYWVGVIEPGRFL